jgi:hypothetical protein
MHFVSLSLNFFPTSTEPRPAGGTRYQGVVGRKKGIYLRLWISDLLLGLRAQ